MIGSLSDAFLAELRSIKASYYKLFLLTLFPLVSFGLVISIFYSGVVREMPLVVVDHDKSRLSRLLLSHIQSSPTMQIVSIQNSTKDALALVQKAEAYALVVIPAHFERDVLAKKQPKVTAMINTQFILIGKILTAALNTTVMHSSLEVEYVKNLVALSIPEASISSVAPIGMQVTPFFNTYQNYFLFLVSALLPAIWQIFIVVATLVTFGSMFKAKEEQEFFKDRNVFARIVGKLLPYTFAYTLLGAIYLFYLYGVLSWVFEGSIVATIFVMFVTVVAYQAVALLFFVTGFDYTRSLSLGAVYTAPAFAFLGVTFPVHNMNGFALFWRDMIPISHYVEFQISQANYGTNLLLEVSTIMTIVLFWLAFIPVYLMFKKRLAL